MPLGNAKHGQNITPRNILTNVGDKDNFSAEPRRAGERNIHPVLTQSLDEAHIQNRPSKMEESHALRSDAHGSNNVNVCGASSVVYVQSAGNSARICKYRFLN